MTDVGCAFSAMHVLIYEFTPTTITRLTKEMGDFAFSFWLAEIRAKSINSHKTGMLFQIADFSALAFYLEFF